MKTRSTRSLRPVLPEAEFVEKSSQLSAPGEIQTDGIAGGVPQIELPIYERGG
jgi:hypothetical protein